MSNVFSYSIFSPFLKAFSLFLIVLSPLLITFVNLNFDSRIIYFELFKTNDIIWQENIWIRYYEYIRAINNGLYSWVGLQNSGSYDIIYIDRIIPRTLSYFFSYYFGFFYGTLLQFYIAFVFLTYLDKCNFILFVVKWSAVFFIHIISIKYLFIESYSSVPVIIRSPENIFAFLYFFYFIKYGFKGVSSNYILLGFSIFYGVHLFILLFSIYVFQACLDKKIFNFKLLFLLPFIFIYLFVLFHNKGNLVFNRFLEFYTGKSNAMFFSLKSELFYFVLYTSMLLLFRIYSIKNHFIFLVPFLVSIFSYFVGFNIQTLHFRLYYLDFLVVYFFIDIVIQSKFKLYFLVLFVLYILSMNIVNINKFKIRQESKYLTFLSNEIHYNKYIYPTFWNGNIYNYQLKLYEKYLANEANTSKDSLLVGSLMIHYYEKK